MAKNQYFTKAYVSQALFTQHFMIVPNKSIKLISNFNGIDLVLVQKCYEGKLYVHTFIMFDDMWYSDDKRKVNPIILKELVKPFRKKVNL
jgi:hypothetical protein